MFKNIILIVLSFLVIISCSNPISAENNKQQEDNNQNTTTIPPVTEEELKKYGVDISQDDSIIIKQIEENLKSYFQEKGIYKVILKGTPKSSYSEETSLSFLIYTAAKNLLVNNIIIDISGINYDSIKSYMFAEGINNQEDVIFTFVFPDNKITVIESYAFHMLSSLKDISIPNSVTTIGEGAFFECDKLEKLTLGSSLKTIGDSAFFTTSSLKELTIPESVTAIEAGAFAYSGLVTLTLPASLTTIGDIAFSASLSLTEVTYLGTTPDNIKNIGKDVFAACTQLTTLKVPNALNPNDDKWKTFLGYNFQTVIK